MEGKKDLDQDVRHRTAARQVLKGAVGQALAEAIAQMTACSQRIVVARLADHVVHRLEQRDLRDSVAALTADE